MSVSAQLQAQARSPSMLLALTELPRSWVDAALFALHGARVRNCSPQGDGHPVLVLPGFLASDGSTALLRRFLTRLGYDVRPWNLGRNLGPRAFGSNGEHIEARLCEIHAETGQAISVIGWSLGGLVGRALARRHPDKVRQVVTLGSPFAGDPRANHAWRLYERLAGKSSQDAGSSTLRLQITEALTVPATSIFSYRDGIVAWESCFETAGAQSESIGVHSSHCGYGLNPTVLYIIADRLAQPVGGWRGFRPDRAGAPGYVWKRSDKAI